MCSRCLSHQSYHLRRRQTNIKVFNVLQNLLTFSSVSDLFISYAAADLPDGQKLVDPRAIHEDLRNNGFRW